MKKFLLSLVSLLMLTLFAQAGEPVKELTFPTYNDKNVQNYTSEWTATVEGDVWTLSGFNNNNSGWAYVRCGSKTAATTATITSPAVNVAIANVVFSVTKTSNVTSATLTILNGETVVGEPIDITESFTAGDVNVKVAGASGYSYKLTLENAKASSNGSTEISKVALYEEGQFEEVHIANTAETAYTVAEARTLIDAGQALGETVYVKGIVSQVDKFNDTYKSIQYWISDDGTTTNQFECYSGKGIGGADFASVDDVKVGATVVVKGLLAKFNEIYEFKQNNELVSYTAPAPLGDDFEAMAESNAIGIRTYAKDIKGEEVATMQEIAGWNIVANGDSRAAGIFAYGSASFLGGEGYVAPAAPFFEGATKALGICAVWSASLQYTKEIALPAGKYMLQVPVYNAGGAAAVANNLIGVDGTYSATKTFAVGGWTVENVEFTVAEDKTVTLSLGYAAANSGSAAMPHIFLESAIIYSGDEAIAAAKAAAETRAAELALAKAKADALAKLNAYVIGTGLFQYSQSAIDAAKAAVEDATTVEEVAAVPAPAVTAPDAEKFYSFKLKEGGNYLAADGGVKLAEKAMGFKFVAAEGGYALTADGTNYVAFIGTDKNTWSMGLTEAPYTWVVTCLADGEYTLSKVGKPAECIGVDNTTAGSSCFANKPADAKGTWAIAEYVAPVLYNVTVAEGLENGTVVASPVQAEEGETVTLTITPAEGYELDVLTVKTGENDVEVSGNTFAMPAADVTVSATFKEQTEPTFMIEVDYTNKLGIDAASWKGASGLCATNYAPAITTKDGRKAQLAENYQSNVNATGDLMTQTVTGLPNGTYRVSIYANAFYTSGRGFESDVQDGAEDVCYVFAGMGENRVQKFITARIATSTTENDLRTLENVKVVDGTLVVGLGKAKAGTNWHTVQVFEITALVDATELLATANNDYEAVKDEKMAASVATALAAAKTAVDAEVTAETLNAYTAAIEAAQASAAAYKPLTEALAKGEEYKAHSSNTEAIETYDTAIAAVKTAYDEGTVEDLAAAIATVNEALPALAKTQTADGSDLTAFIMNPEVNGADGWTIERPKGGNGPLLRGTSFEYWAGNADPRNEASFDYWQEITGLPNGLYTISADMYNSLNDEAGAVFTPTSGVYAKSGEAEVVKLVDVDSDVLAPYTSDAIVVANGTLRIGVKNSVTPMAARWFVADNFKLTLVKALDETGIAYEQALASIEDGKGYRVFTEVGENKFYLTTTGTLVASKEQAASFNFKAVTIDNGAYPTGWNLGCKFTNPSLTNGSTGDIVQNGKINVEKKSDRNDWERQVFFLKDGKYAVRATNAKGSNWGANTYWTVTNTEAELPNAGYSLDMNYVWQLEDSSFDLLMKDLNDIIARGNAFAVECGEESLAALNVIDVAALTTSEQVAAAIAEAKSIIANYIAGVEYTRLLNVTTAVVANPTPMTIDGWEGDSFGDASDGVCEYWNKAAADFHQTVTLPAGNYRLTVVALQRVNQTGVVYAGENKTTIVQVASSVANKRAEAADWFAAGNGKNEVYFNMAEAGDIVIGLTADGTTSDYWTVWQSFKLEKVGEFYTVSVAETENGTVTADKLVGIEGTKVTLTITPAEGYELDVLTVKAGENDVEVSENTFVMPAGNVTVSASFKLIPVAADITLASVTYGGEAVTFDENKAATIEGAYDAEKELVVVATAAEDVTVDVAYPTEVGETQIVITVADKDTENFPNNKATYTITFSVATGINALAAEDGKAVIYDMNGRRVSRNAKGVLIINGKKQLIK